jgi:neurofibromin 1
LQSVALRRLEIDGVGVTRRIAARPRAKRTLPEPLSEKEILILGILSVWRASPPFFQSSIQSQEDMEIWVAVAMKLWEAPIDISVKIMMVSCMQAMYTFLSPPIIPNHMVLINIIKMTL